MPPTLKVVIEMAETIKRKGLTTLMPLPVNEIGEVVASHTFYKRTKWLRRKYRVIYLITKNAIYEYEP
jgi:hypothetical protein